MYPKNGISFAKIPFMKRFIGNINGKHGTFDFPHYDMYIGMALREYGEFSEIEFSIMKKYINQGDYVMDIGANIGAFTVPFSKKVGSAGKVFAFEPQDLIFKILKKNIIKNSLKNVKSFNYALGYKEACFHLKKIDYSKVGNFGGVSLKYDNSSFTREIKNKNYKVDIFKLDNFLNIKKCNFVKIDVEMMEMEVLRGGENFINKFRPILWIENHRKFPNHINKFLINNKYEPFWVDSLIFNNSNFFKNKKNYYKDIRTLNTLAIPKEKNQKNLQNYFDKIVDQNSKPIHTFVKVIN